MPKTKRSFISFIVLLRLLLTNLSILSPLWVGVKAYSSENKDYTYEINSEFVTLKNNSDNQYDFKFLLAYKNNEISFLKYTRLAIGGNLYGQNTDMFGSSTKQGTIFQIKQNLYKDYFYFKYEYFSDYNQTQFNKYGLIGNSYFKVSERYIFDLYAESFYIPEVSQKELLSTGRISIYDKVLFDLNWLNPLIEVYSKSGPANWGGEYSELRAGLYSQPWPFLSIKIYSPVLHSYDSENNSSVGAQINLFYIGDL